MLKRLLVALVGVVGVVVIALGVASATIWRADDVLVATLDPDSHVLVTDPGVLELAASEVTVRAEVDDDQPVVLAVGRDTDVAGWVGTDPHRRVTGLEGWHELAVADGPAPTASPAATAPDATASPTAEESADGEEAAAEGEETAADAEVPDPRGSDLWVAEESGTGEVELTWTAQPGRWSVLAVGPGESAPRLSLAWPQEVTTPWLVPCVVVGSLLLLAALALLARDLLRSRRRRPDAEWTPVLTGPLPVLDAEGAPVQLTRRQLRELRERGAAVDAGVRAARDESTPAQEATAAPPAGPVAAARPAAGARDADATATTALPAAGAQEGRRRPQGAGDEEPTTGGAAGTRRGLRGLVSRGTADDRPSGASAAPRDEPVRPQRPTGRPDAAGDAGGPAPSGAAPGTGPRGGWSTEPGRPSDAAPGGSRPPASGAPRPAWLQGSSGAPAAGPTGGPAAGAPPAGGPGAPPAGPGTGSRGWVPVPPPPGPVATTRGSSHPDHPTRPAGPAPTSTSRPAWLRDAGQQGTGQQGTGQGAPGQGGVPGAGTPLPPPGPAAAEGPRASGAAGTPDASSRADAWRRAWGLPPLPPEADDRTDREEGR